MVSAVDVDDNMDRDENSKLNAEPAEEEDMDREEEQSAADKVEFNTCGLNSSPDVGDLRVWVSLLPSPRMLTLASFFDLPGDLPQPLCSCSAAGAIVLMSSFLDMVILWLAGFDHLVTDSSSPYG
jgi:hypothetical protein